MNKRETQEVAKIDAHALWAARNHTTLASVGILARGYSALARATRTKASRNEIITHATAVPAVVQHPEFIV